MKRRSFGVMVFGILFTAFAALDLVIFVIMMTAVTADALLASPLQFILPLAFVVAWLVAGIGLLLLQEWARVLMLCLAIAFVFWYITQLWQAIHLLKQIGSFYDAYGGLLVVMRLLPKCIVNGIAIWYFLRPSVKTQFTSQGR